MVRRRSSAPAIVIEPTCGAGAFLQAAAATFPHAQQFFGIEIQRDRYGDDLARLTSADARIHIRYGDAYAFDFRALAPSEDAEIAVIGNPPWMTTAALGSLTEPALQPPRSNPKKLSGLAARTGAANFDVAEFLILKLLRDLRERRVTFGLLIKENVARNVLDAAADMGVPIASAEIVRIDARRWFGASVDACAFLCTTGVSAQPLRVPVRAAFDTPLQATYVPNAGRDSIGASRWRQGIKHDAADVFEVVRDGAIWRNGLGAVVTIEAAHLYPLCKARELHAGAAPAHALVVPQKRLGERTEALAGTAPLLWAYLHAHAARLAARKSSIYRGQPPFATFGIGPYSFASWKVAVAGFYHTPRFRVLGPVDGRPTMVGDTAYFVPFDDESAARAFAQRCAMPEIRDALAARIVRGKRPITKRLLDAIDWDAANGSRP